MSTPNANQKQFKRTPKANQKQITSKPKANKTKPKPNQKESEALKQEKNSFPDIKNVPSAD